MVKIIRLKLVNTRSFHYSTNMQNQSLNYKQDIN